MFLAAIAALCLVTFSSCNSTETIIQRETKAANLQCPMSIGAGLTMTSVEYEGRYVMYNYKGDESSYSFNQTLVTNEIKNGIIEELRLRASNDKNMQKFINALKTQHVGIIYHYYTSSSSMDVIIEPEEL